MASANISAADTPAAQHKGLSPMAMVVLGGMLFSMFFGAGNLILPPLLGLQAGSETVPAVVGFLVAGIGLPILGIIAVALCGNIQQLAGRVSPRFAAVFVALIYLTIGPFLAIPRTSTTAFEMMGPLLGDQGSSPFALIAFSVAFFAVAFALALRPSMLSRVLGRFSAPALICLIIMVVGAVVLGGPYDIPDAQPLYADQPAIQGFFTGYQTMDLLAALCFGIVVAANVREQGVTEPGKTARAICIAGLIAGALMAAIYCGLAFVGATAGGVADGAANGAAILAAQASVHFGTAGSVIVAAIFLLACLNVCTGLISCCSEYFAGVFPRIKLPVWAAIFTVFSCCVSLVGLDAILAFSAPLLSALYPPAIALVVMGMVHGLCDKLPRIWPWTVLAVTVYSLIDAARAAISPMTVLPVIDWMPGAEVGLGWIAVAVAAAAVGVLHSLIDKYRA